MPIMSMRLSDDLAARLAGLAESTGRTKSALAGLAIRDFVERETWQIAEIRQAIKEADTGDFASEEEVKAVSAKWKHCHAR
ncbi:hypothetical protein FACS1894206_00630 [Deltaproteobacteria bacterium]|nr:hypothetical protein FACS1894206_00630 [Deltaproteobacteria bacterium]